MTDNERGELFKKAAEARLKIIFALFRLQRRCGASLLRRIDIYRVQHRKCRIYSDRLRRAHRLFQSRVGR